MVRAFLDYRPPYGTRELAALSGNAPASISRVAELLERDAIIERASPRGAIVSVDWKRLLHRWAVDYDFSSANRMMSCSGAAGTAQVVPKSFGKRSSTTRSPAHSRVTATRRLRNPGWPPFTLRTLVAP